MAELDRYCRHLLGSLEEGVTSEFFYGLAGEPLDPHGELGGAGYENFDYLYRRFSPESRHFFELATLSVLESWNPKTHQLATLSGLTFIAADRHLRQAVPILVRHTDESVIDLPPSQDRAAALRATVGVVGVFAPDLNTQKAFSNWSQDDRFDRYAGMILNGLCICSPNDYPFYMARFMQVRDRHPDYFITEAVLDEMIRVVSPEILNERSHILPVAFKEAIPRPWAYWSGQRSPSGQLSHL